MCVEVEFSCQQVSRGCYGVCRESQGFIVTDVGIQPHSYKHESVVM